MSSWGYHIFRVLPDTPSDTPKPGVSPRTTSEDFGQSRITEPLYYKGFRMPDADIACEVGGEGGTRTLDPTIMSRVL